MKDKTGGPAFPTSEWTADGEHIKEHHGMTLRDYFAAKALPSTVIVCVNDHRAGKTYHEYCAEQSYKMADAMLEAREATKHFEGNTK